MENLDNFSKPDKENALGEPDCEICGGIGWVRQDLPITHPDFGRMQVCECRQSKVAQQSQERLFRLSNLQAFSHMTLIILKLKVVLD